MNTIFPCKSYIKRNGLIILAKILAGLGFFVLISSLIWIVFDENYFSWFTSLDSKTASELGGFLSGFVGIFWTAAGVILIYSTFKKQTELNDKQHFETNFFHLIDRYHKLIESTEEDVDIKNDGNKKKYSGREFMSAVLKEIKSGLSSESFKKELSKNTSIPEINEFHRHLAKTSEDIKSLPKPEEQIHDQIIGFEMVLLFVLISWKKWGQGGD